MQGHAARPGLECTSFRLAGKNPGCGGGRRLSAAGGRPAQASPSQVLVRRLQQLLSLAQPLRRSPRGQAPLGRQRRRPPSCPASRPLRPASPARYPTRKTAAACRFDPASRGAEQAAALAKADCGGRLIDNRPERGLSGSCLVFAGG